MLDCENRLNAASYFLGRARQTTMSEPQYVWYIQATVIFAIAALENLKYDYAERKTQMPLKDEKISDSDFRRRFSSTTHFYDWLTERLNGNSLYNFLRNERHLIIHRGEPPKKYAIELQEPQNRSITRMYFKDWDEQTVEEACQSLLEFVQSLIREAKESYTELA